MINSEKNAQKDLHYRIKSAIIALGLVILTRSVSMLPVYRDHLQKYLGIGDRIFGLLFSLRSITAIFIVVIGGVMVDRLGPRKALRICFTGISAAMLFITISGPHWLFFAAALAIYGVFASPLPIAINTYLIHLFPDTKRKALALNLVAGSLGGFFFPAIAEMLLSISKTSATISFSHIVHLPYALVMIVLLAASFRYREKNSLAISNETNVRFNLKNLLVAKKYFWLILLMAFHGMADAVLYIWMARYLGSSCFNSQPVGPGFILSGYAVAYLLSRLLLALVPEKFGQRTFIILPGIIGGATLAAGILRGSYLSVAVGYIVGAFFWSSEYPAMLSVLANNQNKHFGSMLALQQLFLMGLITIGLNSMGFLIAQAPETSMWYVMLIPPATFICIGVGAAVWVIKYGKSSF